MGFKESLGIPFGYGDLMSKAKEIGFPSFDEFCKNPDKYRQRPDDVLASASNGSKILRRDLATDGQVYYVGGRLEKEEHERDGVTVHKPKYIGGYKVTSLEKVDQICSDLGWRLLDLDMKCELERTTAGKYIIHTFYVNKREGNDGGKEGEGMPLANRGGVKEDA